MPVGWPRDVWDKQEGEILDSRLRPLTDSLERSWQQLQDQASGALMDVATTARQAMPTLPSLPDPRSLFGQPAPETPATPEAAPSRWSLPDPLSLFGRDEPAIPDATTSAPGIAPARPAGGVPAAMPTGAGPAVPAPSPGAVPVGAIDNSTRQAFARTAYPYALSAAGGDPELAKRFLASAISENGTVGAGGEIGVGFNFGGIKHDPDAIGSGQYATWESEGGQRVNQTAGFAHYAGPQEGFNAIPRFLQRNFPQQWARYQQTRDAAQLYRDINAGGYATDQNWHTAIESIAAHDVAPAVSGLATTAAPPPAQRREPRELEGAPARVTTFSTPNLGGPRKATRGIVVHSTRGRGATPEDEYQKTLAWFANPQSEVSAHAVIAADGTIATVGDWDAQTWHAGENNADRIGVELVQSAADNDRGVPFTDAQYRSLAWLTGQMAQRYGFKVDRNALVGHEELEQGQRGGKTDPGKSFDWNRYVQEAGTYAAGRPVDMNAGVPHVTPAASPPSGTPAGSSAPDPAGVSPLDEARASTYGDAGDTMLRGPLSQQPTVPPVEDDFPGNGTPGLGISERGPVGIREAGPSPSTIGQGDLHFPVDQPWQRIPPYGMTDPDGVDPFIDRIQGQSSDTPPAAPAPVPDPLNELRFNQQRNEQAIYRQPLSQQPELPADDFDPRDADQGARESGPAPWSPLSPEPAPVTPPATYGPDLSETSAPPPSPYAPGQVEAMTPPPEYQMPANPDPWSTGRIGEVAAAATGPGGLLEPAGGAPRMLERMDEIATQASRELGVTDPNEWLTRRAVRDERWRAANPELAAEYDALENQLGLTVVGQVGDAAPAARALQASRRAAGEVVEGVGSRIRRALAGNAENVARADARMAAEGSTVAPGVFGLSGIEPDLPAARGLRPRVVPVDVADELDFPVRIPDDPATVRAIEAAGGTVDPEKGVTLNVIRYHAPDAAGNTATRGGVFYTAGPPGSASPYASGKNDPTGVGGTQRIEGWTRFRSPLILSDAPGEMRGFNSAMEQLSAPRVGEAQRAFDAEVARYQEIVGRRGGNLDELRAARDSAPMGPDMYEVYDHSGNLVHTAPTRMEAIEWAGRNGMPSPDIARAPGERSAAWREADAALQEVFQARYRLSEARKAVQEAQRPTVAADIDAAIREARRAGPEGSPARAAALKDVVARYGGDPDLIDPLLAIRGADASESTWAIKENILTANARKQGYDGVVTVQQRGADEAAVLAHPQVVAAKDVLSKANEAFERASDAHDASPTNANWRAVLQADEDLVKAKEALDAATAKAFEDLSGGRITELVDPREAANPTPGKENPIWTRTKTRLEEQLAQAKRDYERVAYNAYAPGHVLTQAETDAMLDAMRRQGDAEGGLRVLEDSIRYEGEPGYTLRSDVRRRTGTPEGQAGETTASVSAGALPPQTTANPDRLATVNRALGQGIASSVSGGVGAQVNAEMNPDDPYAGLKGFAVGALAPQLAARGVRAGLRAAGRAADDAGGGALATFGIPPNLAARFPGMQSAAQRAARMAANPSGPQPLSPIQWTRKLIGTIGYSSMIGPSTATVNVFGNLLEPAWAIPKEAARAIARGNAREFTTMAAGAFRGMGQVGQAMVDALAARGRYASNPDHPHLSEQTINPIGHALAQGLEFGGRIFSGMPDAIFGTVARSAGEAREAAQIATDMGLKGDKWKSYVDVLLKDVEHLRANPTTRSTSANAQRVLKAGEDYATRQTFRDELGTVGKGASALAGRNVPVFGNLITPFFNTPWNMSLRVAERSPIGAVMNSQGTRFDKYYDALAGTALLTGLAVGPAAAGHITGSGPDDVEKRKMLEADGWRPYHTLIGGTYYPNRVFGIYGKVLNAAGDIHDAAAYQKKDATEKDLAGDALRRFGRNLKEEPYLQGMAEILGAIGEGGTSGVERFVASTATRLVPYGATARAIGTSLDPNEREVDRGKGVSFGEGVSQRVQQGIGMRAGLPVAQNIMGEPRENPQQGALALLPKTATARPSPVVKAYLESGVDISMPPSEIDGVKLSPAQQRTYRAAMGRELEQLAGPVVSESGWQDTPPEVRKMLLETFQSVARTLAKVAVADEGGDAFAQDRAQATVDKALGR